MWYNCTHWSCFAAHFLFLLTYLAPAAVVQALTRRGRAHKVVIAVQTTVATGPIHMNWLITDKQGEEGD